MDDTVCRSKVLRSSTAGRGQRGGSAQFMRRNCKVVVIKEGKTVRGKDDWNDSHGYLEEHIREECKTPVPTFGFLGKKWGGLRYVMYRIVLDWDGFTQDVKPSQYNTIRYMTQRKPPHFLPKKPIVGIGVLHSSRMCSSK